MAARRVTRSAQLSGVPKQRARAEELLEEPTHRLIELAGFEAGDFQGNASALGELVDQLGIGLEVVAIGAMGVFDDGIHGACEIGVQRDGDSARLWIESLRRGASRYSLSLRASSSTS